MQSSKILQRFHRRKNENVQQLTNALFSRLFEGQLQSQVRIEPQKDPKTVKNFRLLFDKLVNF